MISHASQSLFHRYAANPVLAPEHWPYPCNTVFNPGATLLPSGETLLLCRVEDHRGHSHLTVAKSHDGLGNWQVDPAPSLAPDPESHPEEVWGVEDPRITWVPELEKYAVAYTSYSRGGPGVSLALTRDFRTWDRLGVIMPPDDKDAALLPHRIGPHWALIHRPSSRFQGAHMWISYSPDLRHWGSHKLILRAREGGWWDAYKIGLSPPPIETREGWLHIYHGVRHTPSGALYRLGLALFDLEQPERCLLRGEEWVFGPETLYERDGDVSNVVFPCGTVVRPDGDTLYMYYGCADSCIGVAPASLRNLLDWLRRHGKPEPAYS